MKMVVCGFIHSSKEPNMYQPGQLLFTSTWLPTVLVGGNVTNQFVTFPPNTVGSQVEVNNS